MIRVWALWQDRSEVLVDLTLTDRVTTPEQAISVAVRYGLVSGMGARRDYLGLHAVPVHAVVN